MGQHREFHPGCEMVATHQAQLRAERAHDRLAQQALGDAGRTRGLRTRALGFLLHSKVATALVLGVPLLYTLNASHAAAQRAPSHAATAACIAAAPSATTDLPQASDGIVRLTRNYPIPR